MEHGRMDQFVGEVQEKLTLVAPLPIRQPTRKAPNRKKHEQQLEEIQAFIQGKEAQKKATADSIKSTKERLAHIRTEKESAGRLRADIFTRLDRVNKEVQKRAEAVQKLRGGIVYQTEEEINAQVRKLEYQIQKNNFKLPEERRIVSEIDRLRRSKKTLKDYATSKATLDELRVEQKQLREEREKLFVVGRDLKRQEDGLRGDLRIMHDKLEHVRKDIDDMREEKRSCVSIFKAQEAEYRQFKDEIREEQRRRDQEEKAKLEAEKKKEKEEIEMSREPYQKERTLCSLLLNYCQSFPRQGGVMSPTSIGQFLAVPSPDRRRSSGFSISSDSSSRYATPLGCSPAVTPCEESPPTNLAGYYRKNSNAELTAGCKTKKTKKNKNERRLSMRKSLTHTPEIFGQFSSLGLIPPATLGDVPATEQLLEAKLASFLQMAEEEVRLISDRPTGSPIDPAHAIFPIVALNVDSLVKTGCPGPPDASSSCTGNAGDTIVGNGGCSNGGDLHIHSVPILQVNGSEEGNHLLELASGPYHGSSFSHSIPSICIETASPGINDNPKVPVEAIPNSNTVLYPISNRNVTENLDDNGANIGADSKSPYGLASPLSHTQPVLVVSPALVEPPPSASLPLSTTSCINQNGTETRISSVSAPGNSQTDLTAGHQAESSVPSSTRPAGSTRPRHHLALDLKLKASPERETYPLEDANWPDLDQANGRKREEQDGVLCVGALDEAGLTAAIDDDNGQSM